MMEWETAKGASDPEVESGEVEEKEDEDEILETRRLHILRTIIGCVIKKTVHCMSEQNFIDIAKNAKVNKSISKYEEKCLSKLYSKFQKLLEDAMKSDIDDYIEKSGFLEAQETISRAIPDNIPTSSSGAAWRPSGEPHQDMKSHEADYLLKYNRMLQDIVEEQDVKIQCLKQHIAHKRVLTLQLMKTLRNMQVDFIKLSSNNSSLQDLIVEMLTFLNRDVKK